MISKMSAAKKKVSMSPAATKSAKKEDKKK